MVNDSFQSDSGEYRSPKGDQNFNSAMKQFLVTGKTNKQMVLRDNNGKELFDIPITWGVAAGVVGFIVAPAITCLAVVAGYLMKWRITTYDKNYKN